MVKSFIKSGIKEAQAEAIIGAITQAREFDISNLVTKIDLAVTQAELKQEISVLRTEMHELKAELKQEIAELRTEIHEHRDSYIKGDGKEEFQLELDLRLAAFNNVYADPTIKAPNSAHLHTFISGIEKGYKLKLGSKDAIDDNAAFALAAFIEESDCIQTLNVSNTKIGDAGAKRLAEAIGKSKSLHTVHLLGLNISTGVVTQLDEAITANQNILRAEYKGGANKVNNLVMARDRAVSDLLKDWKQRDTSVFTSEKLQEFNKNRSAMKHKDEYLNDSGFDMQLDLLLASVQYNLNLKNCEDLKNLTNDLRQMTSDLNAVNKDLKDLNNEANETNAQTKQQASQTTKTTQTQKSSSRSFAAPIVGSAVTFGCAMIIFTKMAKVNNLEHVFSPKVNFAISLASAAITFARLSQNQNKTHGV